MSVCQSVRINRDTHRSDVGTGIINAVYLPSLTPSPTSRLLWSKSVFSSIFISQSGAEVYDRQVEGRQACLSLAAHRPRDPGHALYTLSAPRWLCLTHIRR